MKRIKRADYDNPSCARCDGGKKWVEWTTGVFDYHLCSSCSKKAERLLHKFITGKP